MKLRVKFKPQDLWIGAYWDRRDGRLNIWVCLLPMLPIQFIGRAKR